MKVGLILGIVYRLMKEDPIGTLKKVANIGYRNLESYSFTIDPGDVKTFGLNMEAKEAKNLFADLGVNLIGTHFYPLIPDQFERFCEYFAEVGCPQVGCGGRESMEDMDEILRKCELMNKAGEIAKQYGLKFYFHNHYHEYRKRDGKYIIHHLQDNTDPSLVWFQMDTYWVARGGADPVAEIDRMGKRLLLLHQKDYSKDTDEPINIFEAMNLDPNQPVPEELFQSKRHVGTYTEVGTGILPIQDYIDAASKYGVEYVILEQDFTARDPYDSIQLSMDAFRKFRGIEV